MSDADDVKSSWSVADRAQPQRGHHVTMRPPRPELCNSQCPWLVVNHGKTVVLFYDHEASDIPMPEGSFTYAAWKRASIWHSGLKDGDYGYGSLCHVRLHGTRLGPENTWDVVSHQCSGALVMQQREVLRHIERGESALTSRGAARVASDMLGREVAEDQVTKLDLCELLARAHPCLLDPEIGSDAVAPPLSDREIEEWGRLRRRAR